MISILIIGLIFYYSISAVFFYVLFTSSLYFFCLILFFLLYLSLSCSDFSSPIRRHLAYKASYHYQAPIHMVKSESQVKLLVLLPRLMVFALSDNA